MSSGKKWDTVATHTHTHTYTHCSSVHLERGEINHALQKDESPGAVAPSKQEKEGASEGRIILQKWREMQQQNEKTKEGGKKHRSDKKKCLKRFPLLIVGFVLRLQTAGGKLPHAQAQPAGVLENPKTSFPSCRTYKRTRSD